MKSDAAIANPSNVIIEQNQRLSKSLVWKLQRNFFHRQGVAAWKHGTVPHYITSNPFIANAYAKVVFGFLRDCYTYGLDPSQPVYIMELGGGSGRLAYHFLQKFFPFFDRSPLQHIRVKYLLTDFADRNLEFWRSHPFLSPFVNRGVLDFARFDMERDRQLILDRSGDILSYKSLKNPLIVLANYVFDSVPADAFSIRNGQLYENLVSLTSPYKESDRENPELLERIQLEYQERPIASDYYNDTHFNTILEGYRKRLRDTTIVFPSVALNCIRNLRHLSGDRLLLISADKGYTRRRSLLNRGNPVLQRHGSFSLMVNYHAIGEYFRQYGGQFLHTDRDLASLEVCAFLLGDPSQKYPETHLAFTEYIDQRGPDDFFTLKKAIEKHYDTFSVPQILAWLRSSGWDANIFLGFFPNLMQQIGRLSESLRQEVYHACDRVWETYYPIGEKKNLAFHLAELFSKMGCDREALLYLKYSSILYDSDAKTFQHMAICYYRLGQWDEARKHCDRALKLNPSLEEARSLRLQIERSSL